MRIKFGVAIVYDFHRQEGDLRRVCLDDLSKAGNLVTQKLYSKRIMVDATNTNLHRNTPQILRSRAGNVNS